jgi:hypothetical protein
MTPDEWFDVARLDAQRRRLPELVPLLAAMQAAVVRLRAADWNIDVRGTSKGARLARHAGQRGDAPPHERTRP